MQGFNMGRYVPPDQEGIMSGNQLHGKHALGSRANKISQVRFEMPYPIWCTNCPKPTIIGQGVRFNAEKKKVGNYHSSPIFSFRMKHVACGGWIEIRTDPKNTAYVVTEGARKRDTGEDKVMDGDIKIMTAEEREKLRSNAFASLEGKMEDKERLEHSKKRLEELQDLSEQWEDPYERNRKLRNTFREGRKIREKEAVAASALQDKMSLGLELLPEHEDDIRRASFVEFGVVDSQTQIAKAISKPLFGAETKPQELHPKNPKKLSRTKQAEQLAAKRRNDAVAEIRDNTRAAMDPFLVSDNRSTGHKSAPKPFLAGIKRKRSSPEVDVAETTTKVVGLVDYDSDG
ncbi:Protein saf4 [Clarireedia jacksonii]